MSRLYVGCRVRILWSLGWPELAGQEGWICGVGITDLGPNKGRPCWVVAPDSWGSDRAPRRGDHGALRLGCSADQLEPILPSGHQACDADFKRDLDRLLERPGVAA